jgi:hypothetical protein
VPSPVKMSSTPCHASDADRDELVATPPCGVNCDVSLS